MAIIWGREREANRIKQANRAAAVGRLMLGQINNWPEFLEVATIDLENLPRKRLKAGLADVKSRLSNEVKSFNHKNFIGMSEDKLSLLYEDIKAHRGLEISLKEFAQKYASIKPEVLKGNPAHLTVCISLWGLQYKYPEDELAKDLVQALQFASEAYVELKHYDEKTHTEIFAERVKIGLVIRKKLFASRAALLLCFNLMEAYLNGLAWDYIQKKGTKDISERQKKLLEDTYLVSFSDKLKKYPSVLTGKELWLQPDNELESFVSILEPYRHSLVHPSPFSAPERFGGYDKLRLLYRIDYDTAMLATSSVIKFIQRIHKHVYGETGTLPDWIENLKTEIQKLPE